MAEQAEITLPETGQAEFYENKKTGETIAKVLPGYFYTTKKPEKIMTVLGSCISACIRDPISAVGGMNHFMLPIGGDRGSSLWSKDAGAANRFGNFAMENLINALIKQGAVKSRLEVKIFGGGRVLDIATDVGAKNIDFVKFYLKVEKLEITASDVGENYARKIIYDPISGRIKLKRLRDVYSGYVVSQEKKLLQSIKEKPATGSVELF